MGMQSASVLIDTAVVAKPPPGKGGETTSTGGGLFDSELKQQQKQIEEQGAVTSKPTADNSEKASNEGTEPVSGSTQQHSSITHHQKNERHEADSESVTIDEKESSSVEMKVNIDSNDVTTSESADVLEVVVETTQKMAHIEKPEGIEEPSTGVDPSVNRGWDITSGEALSGNKLPVGGQRSGNELEEALDSSSESRSVGETKMYSREPAEGIPLTDLADVPGETIVEPAEGIPLMDLADAPGETIIEPAEGIQLADAVDSNSVTSDEPAEGIQLTNVVDRDSIVSMGEVTAKPLQGSEPDKVVDEYSVESVETVTTKGDIDSPVKSKIALAQANAEIAKSAVAAADQQIEVEQQVVVGDSTKESAPVAVAPLTSVTPLSQGSKNSAVTPNSTVPVAANTITNHQSGQAGDPGSNNADSMAGRQYQPNVGANSSLAEGDENESSNKAETFLATLRAASKDGAKGVDMVQVAAQNGSKPQAQQFSQLISQLSPVQGSSQGQVVSAVTPVASADSTPALMTIASSMRQQGWDRAMGERLVFMARNGIQEAQIQVNPRQMGPIDIKVSVNQEQQANVTFVTTNSAARETIDASLPRLREMFDQAGLNLAESDVSQREQHQSGKGGATDSEEDANELVGSDIEGKLDESSGLQVGYVSPAGLDLFA